MNIEERHNPTKAYLNCSNPCSILKEKEALYESILETMDEGFLSIDRDWQYTYINQKTINLMKDFDLQQDFVGKMVWEVTPKLLGSLFESSFREVMEYSNTQTFERNSACKNYWTEIRICSYSNGIAAFIRDITDKKQKEIELKISEERFSKAFNLSPVALSIFKIQQNSFVDVNKSFLDLFDLEYQEVIGLSPKKLGFMKSDSITEDGNELPANKFNSTFNRKSGDSMHIICSTQNFEINGQPHILMSMLDVTESKIEKENITQMNLLLEKKVNEKTIELTNALKREKDNNDLKSRFVSMASHEFKTPLAGLLLSTSILEQYTKPEDNPHLFKHFNRIKTSVNNLTEILNNFLSLDKIEKGMDEKTIHVFNLKNMIETIMDEMKGHLKKGQKINMTYNGSEEITQDNKKLYNALLNLISNASKYSPEEKPIDIIVNIKKARGIISVKDYGIGIPLPEQKNIFTLFFRAKNTEYIQGTGLGLSIIKKYMELIGGTIYFKSKENEGSEFTLDFSINPKPWMLF